MPTKIEWAEETWNPVTGCSPISEGCRNCYAERMSKRLAGRCGYPADDPFRVTLHPHKLDEPLKWKKPRRVFVCSMGDLFHEDVPDEFIARIWGIMANCLNHTFQVITKRPHRMMEWLSRVKDWEGWKTHNGEPPNVYGGSGIIVGYNMWPLPNVWLGVTAENQQMADERIPILLETPAAVRFVSVEPMLGPVDLDLYLPFYRHPLDDDAWERNSYHLKRLYKRIQSGTLDWVICSGETGPGARPMHPDWVRSLKDQCQEAGVPFFFKQWGEWFPRDQWEWNPELILPDDEYAYRDGSGTHVFEDIDGLYPVHRVGKKAAGRLLDGREWNEMP